DDERLSRPAVPGGEHAGLAGREAARVGGDVAARIEPQAEALDQPLVDGMDEAHREQDEVGGDLELAAGDLAHVAPARGGIGGPELEAHGVQLLHAAGPSGG